MKRNTHARCLLIVAFMVSAGAVTAAAQDRSSEPAGPQAGTPIPPFTSLVEDLSATILKYAGFE